MEAPFPADGSGPALPIIISLWPIFTPTFVQSLLSLSMPPLTMIFCLSGGTPVSEKSCILNRVGGWDVSISTS